MKKYELTTNTKMRFGRKLFQIKALVSFGDVTAGDAEYAAYEAIQLAAMCLKMVEMSDET